MSIFSQLFKSRDKPTNLTNGSAYRFLMGTSSAGKKAVKLMTNNIPDFEFADIEADDMPNGERNFL